MLGRILEKASRRRTSRPPIHRRSGANTTRERRGLQLVEVAGGYQIVTRPELHEWVRRLFHERTTQKLSVASLETLAVIAYKQPVTAPEIADIRGVNTSRRARHAASSGASSRSRAASRWSAGRSCTRTTREFLDRFGLNDSHDLPKVEDMADALGFDPPLLEDVATTAALPFGDGETAGPGTDVEVVEAAEDPSAGE